MFEGTIKYSNTGSVRATRGRNDVEKDAQRIKRKKSERGEERDQTVSITNQFAIASVTSSLPHSTPRVRLRIDYWSPIKHVVACQSIVV